MPLFNPVQGKSKGGGDDAFIAGFKSDGSTPVFSTYFGGNNVDSGAGIALDRTGNVYIVGSTFSQTFPTVNSFQPHYNDNKDAFVAKIDPLKPKIIYSTFLGGSSVEELFAIDVTRRGKAAVVGWTDSKDFPLTNAVDHSPKPTDGFVSEISPTGKLLFST